MSADPVKESPDVEQTGENGNLLENENRGGADELNPQDTLLPFANGMSHVSMVIIYCCMGTLTFLYLRSCADNAECSARKRQDFQGGEGVYAGVRERVHFVHHQRGYASSCFLS